MKKIFLITSVLAFSFLTIQAQNEQDALRFSFFQTGGTTRSLSMGGAFGAVGGDFASLAINPAGLGIYRKGEFAFTTDFNSFKSDASYLGSSANNSGFKMGLSHFGFVIPLSMNRENSGIKGISFAVGYNKLKDYGQNITMKGVNNTNSLTDEFVYTANHNSEWDPFADGLAWETYLIDYDSLAGVYYSDFNGSNYGQTQRRTVNSSGTLGEFDFSLAANLSDKLFLGATMGVQKANYNETWVHTETDPDNVINFFESYSYQNKLSTQGTGVNFKLGLLAKPFEFLRLGASIQTPTVLKLNDDFQSSMSTYLDDGQGAHEYSATGEFDYEITTPLRATASAAFIYKQLGLISVDYEFVDYTAARLSSSDYDFFNENEAVSERFRTTSNLRIGAEFHLAKYYLRGGFASYGNPYADGEPNAGKNLVTLSGGLGYRDNSFYVDFGLARSAWDQEYFLYGSNSALVNNTFTRFSTTIGFRF
jgi:hypothetical protein